jgi:hypothetical protein
VAADFADHFRLSHAYLVPRHLLRHFRCAAFERRL